jgi:hypothetical protein
MITAGPEQAAADASAGLSGGLLVMPGRKLMLEPKLHLSVCSGSCHGMQCVLPCCLWGIDHSASAGDVARAVGSHAVRGISATRALQSRYVVMQTGAVFSAGSASIQADAKTSAFCH